MGLACRLEQWRDLAPRYDAHALAYRAAVVLNAVIAWTQAITGPLVEVEAELPEQP